VLTLLVATAPSLVLLTYFYLRDRFEREPLGHLVAAYLLGMYAMLAAHAAASLVEGLVSPVWLRLGGAPARLVDAFVLSGLIEEVAKWIPFVAVVYRWAEFDEPLDGVIYGVALSLGFATLENVLFVRRLGLEVAWPRAVFAVPAHALFGGSMGYYLGRARFQKRLAESEGARNAVERAPTAWADWVACLALPVIFHGVYDFALLHGLGFSVWVSVTAISVGLWLFVLRRIHQAQRLSPYRPKTMLPASFGRPQP
jgi:RsiW-degrading membrane proteinase PrsW (M82 family)